MVIIKKAGQLNRYLNNAVNKPLKKGFVPTMGALHQGHISLIEASKSEMHLTVCSIFVNPTQFNDFSDFEKYPVTIETDIEQLEKAGCDILFLPSVTEIYPNGIDTGIFYQLGELENVFEGKYRPGHFQGVCRAVDRLIQIVSPDTLYLGQKDYQQYMVLSKLIDLKNYEINIRICPTVREKNGLAMSSRNLRLSEQGKEKAAAIFHALEYCRKNFKKEIPKKLKNHALQLLLENGFTIDYFELTDAHTLEPVLIWDGKQPVIALVAAFLEDTRLIDNMKIC